MIMFKDRSVSKIHTLITLPYKKSKSFHGKPFVLLCDILRGCGQADSEIYSNGITGGV